MFRKPAADDHRGKPIIDYGKAPNTAPTPTAGLTMATKQHAPARSTTGSGSTSGLSPISKMLLQHMANGGLWTNDMAEKRGLGAADMQMLRARGFIKDDYRRPEAFKITDTGLNVVRPREVDEAYQNGSAPGTNNQLSPNTTPATPAVGAPPVTPGSTPVAATIAPTNKPATAPPNPTDLAKAQVLAAKLAAQPNYNPNNLASDVQANIGSMGKSQDQVSTMTDLVRAQMDAGAK